MLIQVQWQFCDLTVCAAETLVEVGVRPRRFLNEGTGFSRVSSRAYSMIWELALFWKFLKQKKECGLHMNLIISIEMCLWLVSGHRLLDSGGLGVRIVLLYFIDVLSARSTWRRFRTVPTSPDKNITTWCCSRGHVTRAWSNSVIVQSAYQLWRERVQ